jgi:hypothetical protein
MSSSPLSDSSAAEPPMQNVSYPRPEVIVARNAGRGVSVIGVIFSSTVLLLEVWAFTERYRMQKRSREQDLSQRTCFRYYLDPKNQVALYLFGISFFGCWVFIVSNLMYWIDFLSQSTICDQLVDPMLPIVWVIMKQFLYLLFYNRAKLIMHTLKLHAVILKFLRVLIVFLTVIGIPCIVWTLVILYWREKVISERICVEYVVSVAGIIAACTSDFIISAIALAIFILPVKRHFCKFRKGEISPALQRLLLRNLIISLLLIVSTLSSLIFMSVMLSAVYGEDPSPKTEYLQIWATVVPLMDACLTIFLSHLLSDIWIPIRIKTFIHSRSSKLQSHHSLLAPWRIKSVQQQ